MSSEERDLIYVINKFSGFCTFSWGLKKISFPYNIPIEVDFTDEPNLLQNLLQCPQLQVCSKKELAAYRARNAQKAVEQKVGLSEDEPNSDVENSKENI